MHHGHLMATNSTNTTVNYPLLVFNELSVDLFTIEAVFGYFDAAIDITTAISEWLHLDHRNVMSWVNAGFFTGLALVNSVY